MANKQGGDRSQRGQDTRRKQQQQENRQGQMGQEKRQQDRKPGSDQQR